LTAWPTGLESCIAPPLTALFTPLTTPLDVQAFNKGELGIVHPWYRRRYLLGAYRELKWPDATPRQLEVANVATPPGQISPVQQWLDVRTSAGAPPVAGGFMNVYKSIPATNDYIQNCNDDAFSTATQTLAGRAVKYGKGSPRLKAWLAAQDMVFENCSQGPTIPEKLAPGSDALDRADRDYQIAASHFYSWQLEAARDEFLAIGRDAESPWRDWGPYLAARAMIRMGALEEAGKQLRSIIADPGQKSGHERADRLLKTANAKLRPVETLAGVGRELASRQPNNIPDLAASYTWMYDVLSNKQGQIEKVAALDDLTDWIHTFQLAGGAPRGYAYEKWHATKVEPWLIAALYAANPESELIRAADAVKRDAPGYLSAQYYAALAVEKTGRDDEARSRLDGLLATKSTPGARNALLAARMKLARNWDEFLRDAARKPGGEDGYDYNPRNPALKRYNPEAPGLDADSAAIFLDQIPLDLYVVAVRDPKLPVPIRGNLAMAAWTRSIVLNRIDTARNIAPALEQHVPLLRSDLEGFRQADSSGAVFAAVFLLLRNPGLTIFPRTGWGRLTPINQRDSFRDNWWCPGQTAGPLSPVLREIYGQSKPEARFLTDAQRGAAKDEAKTLAHAPPGADFLAETTLSWAGSHPDDPRVPEALHRVVLAMRYGCGTDPTRESSYSKRAFTVLHKRYPNSEWTKKTKYWY
jgi:hypothetical protein